MMLERSPELDAKIAACREATKAYRDAFKRATVLVDELIALGICGQCAIGEHMRCANLGCTCCGAGK